MNEEQKVNEEFKGKAEAFLKALEALQKEHQIGMRPIITQFGPDVQLTDLTKVEKEEVKEVK